MAEKVSTLIIEANIECEKCYKKLQKVLCKLQEKEKIRNINFDTKKNTVTISGPFDPVELARKLRCMACGAITDIKTPPPPPPPAKATPPMPPSTTVNLQFTQICNLCYPWPCSDPSHRQPPPMCSAGNLCGGTSYCGGCGSCRGMQGCPKQMIQPPPKCGAGQFTQMCNICYPWPCSDPSHYQQYPPRAPASPKRPCGDPSSKIPERKKVEEKKPEEKKSEDKSTTTVNLQFTQMCNICYPRPCSDPSHYQQYPPRAPACPKRPCGDPSYCGGCGSCGGGGSGMQGCPPAMPMQMMQPAPMCSRGPSSCRGCKCCRIVQEGSFFYEEYPQSPEGPCAVM